MSAADQTQSRCPSAQGRQLLAGQRDYAGANAEDPDEYNAENVFWVPADARWSHLQANAKQPTIGKLDKQRLAELIDVIATIELTAASEGEKTHRPVDLLGRVYEYFLTHFASAKGKNGGQQPKQSNATTRRLAVMNPALRGIEADFGPAHADTFRRDLRAHYFAIALRDSTLIPRREGPAG